MYDFQFNLGDEVKDRITGFQGVIISRTQWLTNCNTYGVKTRSLDKDGKPQDSCYFDEPNLELVGSEVFSSHRDGRPREAHPGNESVKNTKRGGTCH